MHLFRIIIFSLLFYGVGLTVSRAQEREFLLVDRFSSGVDEKGIPVGWMLEKTPGSKSKISIEREKEGYFLHLLSVDDAFGLKKDISFDIRQYPYLSWQWKVTRLPKGGDIRNKNSDDQAGQIYVIFPRFPAFINSLSIGYIWDAQAPVGFSGTSPTYSRMKYVVLQSASSKLNQWIFETRNVYEDYKKLFQGEPIPAGAVLLYINSQHTRSSAECNYTNITFSSSPPRRGKEDKGGTQ